MLDWECALATFHGDSWVHRKERNTVTQSHNNTNMVAIALVSSVHSYLVIRWSASFNRKKSWILEHYEKVMISHKQCLNMPTRDDMMQS